MKLEIITAPSGFGKTEYVLEDIVLNRDTSKIIVLTPEQNGYNFEKLLCEKFKATFNIDVMNFNSLARLFSKKLDITNDDVVGTELKLFYYLEIAEKLKSSNNFLVKRILQDVNFIATVEEIISELKQYNILPEELLEYTNDIEDTSHKDKIIAILEIYVEYTNMLLNNKKIDKEDFISNVLLYLEYIDLSNYIFYIDAYYNFTSLEYLYIQKLIEKSKKVVITVISEAERYINFNTDLLIEGLEKDDLQYNLLSREDVNENIRYSLDIYRKSHEFMANLNNISKNLNLKKFNLVTMVAKDDIIYDIKFEITDRTITQYSILSKHKGRFDNKELQHLVSQYPKISKSPSAITNNIKVFSANGLELEMRQVAREIFKLKKENSVEDDDIAILYRDDNYEKYVNIFKDYNINVHLDKDIDIKQHRLLRLVKNVLNFDKDSLKNSILNILKSNLTNFENIYNSLASKLLYCGDLKISNKQLEQILTEEQTDIIKEYGDLILSTETDMVVLKKITIANIEELFYEKGIMSIADITNDSFLEKTAKLTVNQIKIIQYIILDIVKQIESIHKQKTVGKYIAKLDNLLSYFSVKMYLDKEQTEYDSIEELNIESIDRQVYQKLLNIMHTLNENLLNYNVDFTRFKSIFLMLLDNIKYRSIPQVNSYTIMAKMDLAKVENKKIIFVIGFNKDVIPKSISSNGIIDDNDKEQFLDRNIFLSPTSKSMMIDEEFVSYIALSRAREKVYVSYSNLTNDYKEHSPSIYFNTLKVIFPQLEKNSIDKILSFNLNNIDYLLDNFNDIYTIKEFNYLYVKLMQYYYASDIDNFDKKEQFLKLVQIFELINKNITLSTDIKEFEIYNDLSDEENEIDVKDASYYNFNQFLESSSKISEENVDKLLTLKANLFTNYSASKIEDFIKNPYIYFVKRVLNIQQELDYDLNPMNIGNFFHAVMDENSIKKFITIKAASLALNEEVDLYDDIVNTYDIKTEILAVLNEKSSQAVLEFTRLINLRNSNRYLYDNIISRLVKAIQIEIKYLAITGYDIYKTEQKFKIEMSADEIKVNINNKVVTRKLKKTYTIPKIVFSGIIDRIDKKEGKYLIIDYKSSETDFKYNEFYNGEISQILSYMLAVELLFNEVGENILGAFYREIASVNYENSKYRLRGLVNKDILLQEEYVQQTNEIIFTRIKKDGNIHGADEYKAYSSKELDILKDINLDNMLTIIEKICKVEILPQETISEQLQHLYNYASKANTIIDKKYPKNTNKELKKLILAKKI